MLLDDAIALSRRFITTGERHYLYQHVNDLADTYTALKTGKKMELLMRRFVRREDDEAFQQRLDLTIAITPAVTSTLEKPYNKVLRNDKIKKYFDFKTKLRNDAVKQMRESFYGRKRSKNKGLDYWIKSRFPMLAFCDPNSWVVLQWGKPASSAEVVQPRPYEVPSCNAWNWEEDNEETKWLWVHVDIMFNKLQKNASQKIKDARAAAVFIEEAGDKFTLYDEDSTIVHTQVDPEYLKSSGYKYATNEQLYKDIKSGNWYIMATYLPNLGFVPAYRLGWVDDVETKGATKVNGWHSAMPYLMKSVKTVSEMDLTMALHTFPQKMQYVQACPGSESGGIRKGCNSGKTGDGNICSACKGAGFKVHTTAQDALYFKLPVDAEKNDLLDLDKMLVYKGPPIELLTFQKEYIKDLKVDCSNAVFTQSQQTKTSGGAGAGGSGASAPITATEVSNNSEGTKDALLPFIERYMDMWIFFIYAFGRLAGVPDDADVVVVCVFPADLKLKSLDELLTDLKTAKEAGAPSFLIDQINSDIAAVMYQGDDDAQSRYDTRHRFFPFNGQSPDEIAFNVSSSFVTRYTKVLYANFEAIFNDIDFENPGFWFMSFDEQAPIVEDMVNAYIDELDTESSMAINVGAGLGGDTAPPDAGNPGDSNPDNPPAADPIIA